GLGRLLLARLVAEQAAAGRSLLGTGFAATAGLLRFWQRCGFVPVRLAMTRSPVSGEHSLIMVHGLDAPGQRLADLLGCRFGLQTPPILADALRGLDPRLALAVLAAVPRRLPPRLEAWEWEDAVAAAFGHRLYDVTVGPLWELCRGYLTDPQPPMELSERERLRLLLKVIQRRTWSEVAEIMEESLRPCMRALRQALQPLVRAYGPSELVPLIARFRGARRAGRG
ncbi:MAG: tRNA(Met) cytidine acetyltransferase, partial [Deltaproteobacteria bacterium]|nr:tRNA(Met) cytidine acetyltransferase [Deltaproteobacteria bacterium]